MTLPTKQCPACKEQISLDATRCKFCTHEMNKNPVTGQTSGQSAAGWISAIGFGILAFFCWQYYQSLGL